MVTVGSGEFHTLPNCISLAELEKMERWKQGSEESEWANGVASGVRVVFGLPG